MIKLWQRLRTERPPLRVASREPRQRRSENNLGLFNIWRVAHSTARIVAAATASRSASRHALILPRNIEGTCTNISIRAQGIAKATQFLIQSDSSKALAR
ncbi:MAG: hypothetical protein L0210_00280 [Rhodospirillales bacterium]|nr:hypothetical protein [Rhodospirillales bacterium]